MKKNVATAVGMLVLAIALAISLNAIGKSMQEMARWNHQTLLDEALAL